MAEFQWNESLDVIAKEKAGGREGMEFLASEAERLMDPYVPADSLMLAQNVRVSADEEKGSVTYQSPYAHYQYEGEVYGPNYPVMDGGEVTGWYSPPFKTPTGRKLQYSTIRWQHPIGTGLCWLRENRICCGHMKSI